MSGTLLSTAGNLGAARLRSVCKHLVSAAIPSWLQEVLPDSSLIPPADTHAFIYFAHYGCSHFSPPCHRQRVLELLALSAAPRLLLISLPQTCTQPGFTTHPPLLPTSIHLSSALVPLRECVNCRALNTHVLPRLTASGGEGDMKEYI